MNANDEKEDFDYNNLKPRTEMNFHELVSWMSMDEYVIVYWVPMSFSRVPCRIEAKIRAHSLTDAIRSFSERWSPGKMTSNIWLAHVRRIGADLPIEEGWKALEERGFGRIS